MSAALRGGTWLAGVLCASLGWGLCPAAALGQGGWQAVSLQPKWSGHSQSFAGDGSLQGGEAYSPTSILPLVWDRASDRYTNLLPAGFDYGGVRGMSGGRQVGEVYRGFSPHAALWSGSAESMTDLTPGGQFREGYAYGISGDQQVGYVANGATLRDNAALWNGSAGSFVNLHPGAGVKWSQAFATDGTLQGGQVGLFGSTAPMHAALWRGTAASFVDLNPPNSRESKINFMTPGRQFGNARFQELEGGIWEGTAESWRSLLPDGALACEVYGSTGSVHVGLVRHATTGGATVWMSDDPNDYVDLQAVLGPEWSNSGAFAVSELDGWLYVSGVATPREGPWQAMLWMKQVPSPSSVTVFALLAPTVTRRRRASGV